MMNSTQRFFKKLRNELKIDVPFDAYMIVTHAGFHQRSSGAWTSYINSKQNRFFEIGLCSPISKLLKCPNLIIYSDFAGKEVMCNCIGQCKGLQ